MNANDKAQSAKATTKTPAFQILGVSSRTTLAQAVAAYDKSAKARVQECIRVHFMLANGGTLEQYADQCDGYADKAAVHPLSVAGDLIATVGEGCTDKQGRAALWISNAKVTKSRKTREAAFAAVREDWKDVAGQDFGSILTFIYDNRATLFVKPEPVAPVAPVEPEHREPQVAAAPEVQATDSGRIMVAAQNLTAVTTGFVAKNDDLVNLSNLLAHVERIMHQSGVTREMLEQVAV